MSNESSCPPDLDMSLTGMESAAASSGCCCVSYSGDHLRAQRFLAPNSDGAYKFVCVLGPDMLEAEWKRGFMVAEVGAAASHYTLNID